ncbi:hypothetical protein C4D60_Mb00t00430 [Musa balbisiana]|uniref:Uncharacterized protein n=1 Tax=Musa balbisiana TaxID=52838 RepID=A0A4S8I6H5_MUSBA|nr:hypothetical protein C4D60_Mb00t00430 [Musa balbisiana]
MALGPDYVLGVEGLAGERSQSAAENKTASERTFVSFFSTKHGSVRITVGRWLPKETPIRSAPCWEASTSSRSQGEVHHDGGFRREPRVVALTKKNSRL